jgi:hypothetical protein
MRRPRLNIQEQQLQLACMGESEGEALRTDQPGAERCPAQCATERPAREEGLREEVCARSNLSRAWTRVREHQGSPGVDGRTMDETLASLREPWPTLKAQLRNGT